MERVLAKNFDLLVIGGGSGGLAHAQRAAEYGVRAGVVESGALGGTCVNVGCVPKKVMWYTAEHAHHLTHAADYGFDVEVRGHDWSVLQSRRDAYIERLNGMYAIAVDDARRHRLLLLRDRLGIKPLFYAVTRRHLVIMNAAQQQAFRCAAAYQRGP